MDWLMGLFGIFRAFGKKDDPSLQSGLWLFVFVGFGGFSGMMLVIASFISSMWYWWVGGILCGVISILALVMTIKAAGHKPGRLNRPRRDIPPSGWPPK